MSVKYSKFDSFLKRILNNVEYKNVKTYEPCVVTSSKERHAFRFTFLTRDRIYITENPPKSLLYSVHLKDVIDVYVVNDKATFLQANLRDRVQHIVVKYVNTHDESFHNTSSSQNFDSSFSRGSSSSYKFGDIQSSTSEPLSLKGHSTPLLCSYANLGSVADRRSIGGASGLSQESDDWYKSSKSEDGKFDKNHNLQSKSSKSVSDVSWEHRDPYAIHVIVPSASDGSTAIETEELHLYILSENTTFPLMLKAVWRNFIVYHSTTQKRENSQHPLQSTIDFDSTERSISDKSVAKKNQMDENTKTLFADLKQEMCHAHDVEHLYGLFNELMTAGAKDVLIKSLFWKDDVLFKRSIGLICRYVKQSNAVNIGERADEMELAVLILQTVAVVLRETEAIPQCYRVLQNLSLPFFKDVVESLLCKPRLLCDSWLVNDEVKSLVSECTVASSEVLCEIIIACQQVSWVVSGKSPVLATTVLFVTIDRSEYLQNFLDRLIHNCITIWGLRVKQSTKANRIQGSHGAGSFTPENALKAFHLFTVFHRIVIGSTTAAQHVKSSFREEFKYYINPGSLLTKFPNEYPISGMARSVVHAVGSYIINNVK